MIRGTVHPVGEPPLTGEATVRLEVWNTDDPTRTLTVEAMIDTGFSGHLSLPATLIDEIELAQLDHRSAVLANGEVSEFSVFAARVHWNGEDRLITVFETESRPLLGMAMLWGSKLTIDVSADGEVVIE